MAHPTLPPRLSQSLPAKDSGLTLRGWWAARTNRSSLPTLGREVSTSQRQLALRRDLPLCLPSCWLSLTRLQPAHQQAFEGSRSERHRRRFRRFRARPIKTRPFRWTAHLLTWLIPKARPPPFNSAIIKAAGNERLALKASIHRQKDRAKRGLYILIKIGSADLPRWDVYLLNGKSEFLTPVAHRGHISIEFHRNLLRAITREG
jgi:hypothetical protein